MIATNGRIIAQGSQFSLNDVEVVSATIDIEDVRAHRAKSSRSAQAAAAARYHRIEVPFALSGGKFEKVREGDMIGLDVKPLDVRFHTPEEEIACVFSIYFIGPFADSGLQIWTSMLAMGLPQTIKNTRFLHTTQWGNRQLCDCGHRLFDVSTRRRGSCQSRYAIDHFAY